MEKYLSVLKSTKLFDGCSEEEILTMSGCLNAAVRSYRKGEYILRAGSRTDSLKVLLSGRLIIKKDNYWGKRSIIDSVLPSEMFGEAYSGEVLLIDVVAEEDSTVISFDVTKLITTCSSGCNFHQIVVKNLFFAISEKNRKLMEKITHITERTTRDKIISYLSSFASKSGSASFSIPFNRQQMADYLGVDRSAMSNELTKMRDEGLILFHKNSFALLVK